jgi:hypothetical protein
MVVMVAVDAVSAAFGLKGGLHLHKIGSEAMKHILNHMVGPNAKKLFRISVGNADFPDANFDNKFRSRLNL